MASEMTGNMRGRKPCDVEDKYLVPRQEPRQTVKSGLQQLLIMEIKF